MREFRNRAYENHTIRKVMPAMSGENSKIHGVLHFLSLLSDGRRLVTLNGLEYLLIVCGHCHRMMNTFYTGPQSARALKMTKKYQKPQERVVLDFSR